ncbi:MAG: TolC family protein [bacterium]
MRTLSIVTLAAVLGMPMPTSAQPRARKDTTPTKSKTSTDVLASLSREALKNNPTLRQIEARIRVAKSKVAQAKAFPDPLLSVGLVNMPFSPAKFNATPMTGLQFTATQVIPWPTKLLHAGKVAGSRVKVVAESLKEARLRLDTMVRATALALAFIDAQELITRQHGKILDGLIQVTDVRYRVSQGLLQDLLKARLARSRIADRLQTIARQRDAVEARLNALLGRKITATVPTIRLPPPSKLRHTVDQLIDLAAVNRPLLAKWRKRIRVEQLRRKLAKTGYLPDFGVSFTYQYRQDTGADPVKGMDFWSVGLAIRIPLWSLSATKARVREAEAGVTRERQGLRSALLEVARDVRTARDAIRRLEARLRIYNKRILPEARQVLQASLMAYTTGKVTFLTVLDHERTLYEHETGFWRVSVSMAQQWEVLRAAVGTLP